MASSDQRGMAVVELIAAYRVFNQKTSKGKGSHVELPYLWAVTRKGDGGKGSAAARADAASSISSSSQAAHERRADAGKLVDLINLVNLPPAGQPHVKLGQELRRYLVTGLARDFKKRADKNMRIYLLDTDEQAQLTPLGGKAGKAAAAAAGGAGGKGAGAAASSAAAAARSSSAEASASAEPASSCPVRHGVPTRVALWRATTHARNDAGHFGQDDYYPWARAHFNGSAKAEFQAVEVFLHLQGGKLLPSVALVQGMLRAKLCRPATEAEISVLKQLLTCHGDHTVRPITAKDVDGLVSQLQEDFDGSDGSGGAGSEVGAASEGDDTEAIAARGSRAGKGLKVGSGAGAAAVAGGSPPGSHSGPQAARKRVSGSPRGSAASEAADDVAQPRPAKRRRMSGQGGIASGGAAAAASSSASAAEPAPAAARGGSEGGKGGGPRAGSKQAAAANVAQALEDAELAAAADTAPMMSCLRQLQKVAPPLAGKLAALLLARQTTSRAEAALQAADAAEAAARKRVANAKAAWAAAMQVDDVSEDTRNAVNKAQKRWNDAAQATQTATKEAAAAAAAAPAARAAQKAVGESLSSALQAALTVIVDVMAGVQVLVPAEEVDNGLQAGSAAAGGKGVASDGGEGGGEKAGGGEGLQIASPAPSSVARAGGGSASAARLTGRKRGAAAAALDGDDGEGGSVNDWASQSSAHDDGIQEVADDVEG